MQDEQFRAKLQKSNERTLALVKASMDVVVAVGLLQLAPKKVTPRVTGALGFASSLISCYQVIDCILRYLHIDVNQYIRVTLHLLHYNTSYLFPEFYVLILAAASFTSEGKNSLKQKLSFRQAPTVLQKYCKLAVR